MITGSPARRVPVGPKANNPSDAAETTVTSYLIGEFEFWKEEKPTLKLRKISVGFSVALVEEIRQLNGGLPERWTVGVDRKRCLICVKPADNGLKMSINEEKSVYGITSKPLVNWLTSLGIPKNGSIEAHWQKETQSVVGRYTPVSSQEDRLPEDAQAPKLTKASSHTWVPAIETSPTGDRLFRCEVCGYYASDPNNPLLKERPCKPHLYHGKYVIRDGKVYPAFTKPRKEVVSGEDEDGFQE